MNGRVDSVLVEIVVNLEVPEEDIGTVAVTKPVSVHAYETRRWLYLLTMPISWLLTLWVIAKKAGNRSLGRPDLKINTLWFDGLGHKNRMIKEGKASWRALDVIYNYQFRQRISLGGLVDDFWNDMMNAQAVRNRLKLVKQEIRRAILRFSDHSEVRLLSLASGSAQAIIEVMAELKAKEIRVRSLLLDRDPTALAYAQRLAEHHGVEDQIETVQTSISQVVKVAEDFRPQVIEMLGFLDYLPRSKAVKTVRMIRQALEPKGVFLTCNIRHNPERYFLKWVINWPMIYRTPTELAEIVTKAGFSDYRLIYEPLKIHGLVIAQKD